MKVRSVDFVVYEVSDVQNSIDFYRSNLGLNLLFFNQESDWAEFVIDKTTFALCGPNATQWGAPRTSSQNGSTRDKGEPSIAFAVENLEQAVEELQQKKVTFITGIKDTGACYFAVFLDPDGNRVWLHQGYAGYHLNSL